MLLNRSYFYITMEEFSKPAVNTLEEVKKLQDRVRQLELQSQQLRNKQNKLTKKNSLSSPKEIPKPSPVTHILKVSNSTNIEHEENIFACNNNKYGCEKDVEQAGETTTTNENSNYMDEIDIIRVSDAEMSDDDSWLYISPKGLTPEQKNESPYKWLRKDVDDPENKELQLAKTALIIKLNELEILSPTSQVSLTQTMNRTVNHLRKPQVPFKSPPQAHEHAHYTSIDTRTFTKSKKKQALEYLASPPILENCKDHERMEKERTRKDAELSRRGSDISLDSSTGTYTLTDASDVQEVARMQEESLRLNSPIGTPKRQSVTSSVSSRRMSVSSRSSISDLESLEQPLSLSRQISEDNNCEAIATTPINTTPTSVLPAEVINHSDQSSPSESPYGSNISLNSAGREKGKLYRSSLPNLNKVPGGLKPKRNVASHDSRQQKNFVAKTNVSGRRSDSNLLAGTKLRKGVVSPPRQKIRQPNRPVPPPASSVPSTSYSQTREYSSKTVKSAESTGRLQVKSGLPRPSRATSATRSSGIPVPSMTSKKCEDSWSDGCF